MTATVTMTALESLSTTADGPKSWRYDGARLEVVRSHLASDVCDAVAKAPVVGEGIRYPTSTTTASIGMNVLSINSEKLYPVAGSRGCAPFRQRLLPLDDLKTRFSHDDGKRCHCQERTAYAVTRARVANICMPVSNAYWLKRASLAVTTLIFDSRLCGGIVTSQLRTWKRTVLELTSATGRTAVKIHATHEPNHGTLRLRLEYQRGLWIDQ
jgi:hypothetical protein